MDDYRWKDLQALPDDLVMEVLSTKFDRIRFMPDKILLQNKEIDLSIEIEAQTINQMVTKLSAVFSFIYEDKTVQESDLKKLLPERGKIYEGKGYSNIIQEAH